MDLFKTFDCVPHDLLLAKLTAYGVDESFLFYIYSYLINRKQCMRINRCLVRIYSWTDSIQLFP